MDLLDARYYQISSIDLQIVQIIRCISDKICTACNMGDLSAESGLSFATLQDPKTGTSNTGLMSAGVD